MLLYLLYDVKLKTLSTPLIAPDLKTAQDGLKELNPENLSDLILYPLTDLKTVYDLFLLRVDENSYLPDFIIPRDISLEMSEDTTEGRESLNSQGESNV